MQHHLLAQAPVRVSERGRGGEREWGEEEKVRKGKYVFPYYTL